MSPCFRKVGAHEYCGAPTPAENPSLDVAIDSNSPYHDTQKMGLFPLGVCHRHVATVHRQLLQCPCTRLVFVWVNQTRV